MASARIVIGGLTVEIDDEDEGYRKVSKRAYAIAKDIMQSVPEVEDEEGDDDGER